MISIPNKLRRFRGMADDFLVRRHLKPAPFLSLSPKPRDGLPGRDWPLHVQIETCSVCNGRCIICPYRNSWLEKHPGRMDEKLFDKIVADLEQYRLGKLCLYMQNEPFADKRWFDLARRAISRLHFQLFEVSTNLVLLDERGILELVELLRDIPHDLWISFHGVDRESYKRIMGLDFDRAIENLAVFAKAAAAAKTKYRIHGYGRPCRSGARAETLFDKRSYKRFFRKLAAERGLPELPVFFFRYHDRAGYLSDPRFQFHFRRRSLRDFYCHMIDTWLHVQYTGEVILCCNDYGRETLIGDLRNQTIEQVFRSDKYVQLRDKALGLIDSEPDFLCRRCAKPGG